MKQNSILNLNKKQLKKIQKSLQDTAYGPTEFSKNKPLSYGETHDDIMCKNKNTLVGINGLFNNDALFDAKSVDDQNFVKFLVAYFHEQRHLYLSISAYENTNDNEMVNNALLVAYIAQENKQYYLQNRTNFITEIDAEFYGIIQAHDYIIDRFPNVNTEEIDKLFVNYVNENITNYTYQIKKNQLPIETFNDIIEAFDQAYDESITSRKRTYIRHKNNKDDVMDLLRKPEYDDIFTQICNEKNPYEKDKMIAALTIHLHPEYKDALPALEHIDLSATTLFHQDLPMDKTQQRTMLANQALNINDDYDTDIDVTHQIT